MNQTNICIHALAATVLLLTGCTTYSLQDAAALGEVAALQQALDNGADKNARDDALGWAVANNRTECVRLLLARGADPDSRALPWAAHYGNIECVRLLLDKGADINARSSDGWTALISAAAEGHATCVQLLLERGAETRVVGTPAGPSYHGGGTAAEWALKQGHPEIPPLIESAERERTRQREEPLIAALPKARLLDLLVVADSSANMASKSNDAIIVAKARDLPGILHDGTSAELTALCVRLEQTILGLNHASEVAKDKAQQAAANGDPQQLDELRGLSICYRERIEILKPILAALKEEIANRNR